MMRDLVGSLMLWIEQEDRRGRLLRWRYSVCELVCGGCCEMEQVRLTGVGRPWRPLRESWVQRRLLVVLGLLELLGGLWLPIVWWLWRPLWAEVLVR